jgi:hypothetical protein
VDVAGAGITRASGSGAIAGWASRRSVAYFDKSQNWFDLICGVPRGILVLLRS